MLSLEDQIGLKIWVDVAHLASRLKRQFFHVVHSVNRIQSHHFWEVSLKKKVHAVPEARQAFVNKLILYPVPKLPCWDIENPTSTQKAPPFCKDSANPAGFARMIGLCQAAS